MDLRSIKYIDSNGNVLYAEPGQEIICTPAASISTAELMKSNQTVSWRAKDDGGFQAGRPTSFTVLNDYNPFGSLDRFSDEFGGQDYTSNIVIDWSTFNGDTVLGYYRTIAGNITWNQAIDSSSALSIGAYTSGWRLANIKEIENIQSYKTGAAHSLDYTPFKVTITSAHSIWTSTTDFGNSANAYFNVTSYGTMGVLDKTAAGAKLMAVRTFTVSGTTLY